MTAREYLDRVSERINREILKFIPPEPVYGEKLYRAVAYALMSGGKRFRPAMCIASCEAFGGSIDNAVVPACSIEMIHNYSLIHDDLPAMDNDAFRRGIPSVWAKFGEATAILSGDALLNRAFEILVDWDVDDSIKVGIIREISRASGMLGMVLGQQCDVDAEGRLVSADELEFISVHKTAMLIEASVVCGGIVGGASADDLAALRNFGRNVGVSFQIVDDVLDADGSGKEGSDEGKVTFASYYGVDRALGMARDLFDAAVEAINRLGLGNKNMLIDLARFVVDRSY